jgi:hypothetical protein
VEPITEQVGVADGEVVGEHVKERDLCSRV